MKQKKAQAGLDIFLSVIALLFVIGIIVMAFVLASAQIQDTDQALVRSGFTNVTDESNLMNGTIGFFDLTESTRNGASCTIHAIDNGTVVLGTGNYSISNCRISNETAEYENQTWLTNYSYTALIQNQVGQVINETTVAISSATDWFAIFITVAAVVVLILLIVLIVVSLRGAGLMGGETGGA